MSKNNRLYHSLAARLDQEQPQICAIHIHDQPDNPSAKFGAIELTDGTIGLTYTKLGDAYQQLQNPELWQPFIGKSVTELANLSNSETPWQQVLGAGALNAISQRLLKQRGFNYHHAEDSLALLDIKPDDRIGMVGYFKPLIAQLRDQGIALTVIELRQDLVQQQGTFEVTTDASALSHCDKVLITGTSVINQTLDGLLSHCTNASHIALVGPSVGLLPELLFEQGVTSIGGRAVVDGPRFLARWQAGEKWGDSVVRYSLREGDYAN